jgi:hypothetical protein
MTANRRVFLKQRPIGGTVVVRWPKLYLRLAERHATLGGFTRKCCREIVAAYRAA